MKYGNGMNPENVGKAINLEKSESMKPQGNNGTVVQRGAASGKQDNLIPFQSSTFQYDNQGNLLREERKAEGNRQESIYSYDGFNRQKKIINFENKVQVNHYDGEGLRHEMEENGKLVKFLYADREAVAEEKEDGNIIRFIRGYDLVASDSESARTYYHYASDEQGSITHVLGDDENGEYSLKNYYEYGAFGDFREQYEEAENRFGYNGEIFDPIGGQYYLRARYYNPVIGRFTQEDTYYGDGLNLYAYCRNLPVGYEDPSGYAAHAICESKVKKLEEKEKNGKLTKEEYQELRRYRRAKDNELYQQERQTGKSSRELYNEQNSKKKTKFDSKWQAYLDDIEKQTGRKISEKQKQKLLEEIRKNPHTTKLTGEQYEQHRKKDWKNNRKKLIEEWEKQTKQKWPTYGPNDAAISGNKNRKNNYKYDAHEIIPNVYDSPMEWWNIFPAANGSEHQGGIHRSGAPFYEIFENGD